MTVIYICLRLEPIKMWRRYSCKMATILVDISIVVVPLGDACISAFHWSHSFNK